MSCGGSVFNSVCLSTGVYPWSHVVSRVYLWPPIPSRAWVCQAGWVCPMGLLCSGRGYVQGVGICHRNDENSVSFQIFQVLTRNPSALVRPNVIVIFEMSSHLPLHADYPWKPYISHIILVNIYKVC